MGEYRRWISYVYGYIKGVKGQSAGYVKIESRNGNCKIYTNIKTSYPVATPLKLYVFYRKDNNVVLVDLGTVSMKKGFCEYTYETKDGNIAGCGLALEQLGGLVGIVDESRYFGTVWDDKEIDLTSAIYHKETVDEENEEEIEEVIEDSLKGVISIEDVSEKSNDSFEETKEEHIETKDTDTGEAIEESNVTIEQITVSEEIKTKNPENNTEKNAVERIFARYPGMYPFEDDEIIECVKLEPQDIGVFPMEKWVLANNSFLLHGYYTYRHLIFAKLRGENADEEYILGVPGLYRDRERFMAGMFGFDNFKGVRGNERDYGEFGYWYMNMDL